MTTGSNYLLDTNIVAAYFNREPAIREKLAGITAYVPGIVIGELYFGAYKSQRVAANVSNIVDFIAISTVLSCDERTGDFYGRIKTKLRAKGNPIPENDIWIAAVALQYDLALVSRDQHFTDIEGLSRIVW